jgi:hypothetical protein
MPIHWSGPTNALVVQPSSPHLTYGERVKAVDIYRGLQSLCASSMIPRGTFGTGFRAGWVCTQSEVTTERGNIGTLTIEWEAGGTGADQPLPAGGFVLEPQELYPKIERNPFFASITYQTVNICRNAIDAATANGTGIVSASFLANNISDPAQLALAEKLVAKWQTGEDTYYLAGWRYSFETFSYTEPALNPGGGIVSEPGGPVTLPAGVAWLRLADHLEPAGVNGSMYKLTQHYLGGPNGYWDSDIYS